MKGTIRLCCLCAAFIFPGATLTSSIKNVVDPRNSRAMIILSDFRDLGVGEQQFMKKPKNEPKKDKLLKAMGNKEKNNGKVKVKGSNNRDDDEGNMAKGKVMAKMKGMMEKKIGKIKAPAVVATATPSITTTPISFTSSPMASVNPITPTPSMLDTKSPSVTTLIPSPVAIDTAMPSVSPLIPPQPVGTTTPAPSIIFVTPSVQPILVSPTNFAFISISNILVRYESLSSVINVTLNHTLEAIDLSCDYIRNEVILPLGALEFACIWFLPDFDENELTTFPIEITYAGTAAFAAEVSNVTTNDLDSSMISAFMQPMVGNLTETMRTDLPVENSFSQTEEIYAVV